MKKILILLLFVSFSSQAETLNQLRTRVDTWLTNKVPVLVARQNTYFAGHGKYWQGLITCSSIPSHVTATPGDTTADQLTLHPTDQAESWHDIFPEWDSEVFAAAAVIDVYDGPQGKGWVLTVFVKYNGTIYSRAKTFGVGTETFRDYDWLVYTP